MHNSIGVGLILLFLQIQVKPEEPKPEPVRGHIWHVIFMAMEVMDEREIKYMLVKPVELEADFKTLIARYIEFKDSPRLNMRAVFPDRETASQLIFLNRAYKSYLENLRSLYPYDDPISDAIAETEFLYSIWDSVRDINTDYYYLHVRKQAMKKLKESLDKIDSTYFYKGILPDPVSTYRFVHIR